MLEIVKLDIRTQLAYCFKLNSVAMRIQNRGAVLANQQRLWFVNLGLMPE